MTKLGSLFGRINQKPFMDIRKRKNYYAMYTILFLVLILVAFGWVFLNGRTLLWSTDGVHQHYKAYIYWGQYLRDAIRSIFSGKSFSLQEWDFALGEGNDILNTFQFYVIGDPFAVFSALVPTSYMHIFYSFMMLFRLYLAGITFSAMCRYLNPEGDPWGRMTGSVCYFLSSWAIFSVSKHPFFLNPMVFFPLIILGVEKILRGDRKRTFVLAVFFSALGNFYFFYQIVLLTVIYVAVRLIIVYRKQLLQMIIKLMWIFLSAVLGTMMAAALVLPSLYAYTSDARLGSGIPFRLFYEKSYYKQILGIVFGGQEISGWLCVGMAGISILAVFLLFLKRKQHTTLKILFLISAVILVIPLLAQILNGLSYVANRWTWAFGLLAAYTVTAMWEDLMQLRRKDFTRLLICLAVCMGLLLILKEARMKEAFMGLSFTLLILFCLFPERDESGEVREDTGEVRKTVWWRKPAVILLTAVNLLLVVFFYYSMSERGAAAYLTEASRLDNGSETKVIEAQAKSDGVDGFYRYAGGYDWNMHTLGGLSNPGYYWSITNAAVSDFIRKVGITDNVIAKSWATDRKTAVLDGSAVEYLIVNGEADGTAVLPYGFTKVSEQDYNAALVKQVKKEAQEEQGTALTKEQKQSIEDNYSSKYTLYKNEYALPLGYVTSNIVALGVWSAYSPVEKQEAMLQGVLSMDRDSSYANYTPVLDTKEMAYKNMNISSDVVMNDTGFVVTKKDAAVKLEIEPVQDCELYLEFDRLEYEGYPEKELYLGDDAKDPLNLYTKTAWENLPVNAKERLEEEADAYGGPDDASATMSVVTSDKLRTSVKLLTPRDRNYAVIPTHSVYLGYSEQGVSEVKISFSEIGTYSYDSFRIVAVPRKEHAARISVLKQYPMHDVQISGDTVTGKVTAPEDGGVLRLAIPYSDGWKARVDGKSVNVLNVDIKYIGLRLEAGEHEIRLEYRTPLLREGLLISGGCILVFVMGITVVPLIVRRCRREKGEEKPESEPDM